MRVSRNIGSYFQLPLALVLALLVLSAALPATCLAVSAMSHDKSMSRPSGGLAGDPMHHTSRVKLCEHAQIAAQPTSHHATSELPQEIAAAPDTSLDHPLDGTLAVETNTLPPPTGALLGTANLRV